MQQNSTLHAPEVEPKGADGDVYDFLSLYERIVSDCEAMIPAEVLAPMQANKGRRFISTLELLKGLPEDLREHLTQLYRYHSCVVNCARLSVKQEMCELAEATMERLLQEPEEYYSAPEPDGKTTIETV